MIPSSDGLNSDAPVMGLLRCGKCRADVPATLWDGDAMCDLCPACLLVAQQRRAKDSLVAIRRDLRRVFAAVRQAQDLDAFYDHVVERLLDVQAEVQQLRLAMELDERNAESMGLR